LTPRNFTNFCHHQASQSGAKALPALVDSSKGLIIRRERERERVLKFCSISSSLPSPPPKTIPTSIVSAIFPGKVHVPVSALQTLTGESPPDFEEAFTTGRAIT